MSHSFHIPVLGLAFSVDTPIKVAKYGITSVLSIVDDELLERMRAYYTAFAERVFEPIKKSEIDSRAKRITAYLDLVQELVVAQTRALRLMDFESEKEINQYFNLLPDDNALRHEYITFKQSSNAAQKAMLEENLREAIQPGEIEVNIMSKVDKVNQDNQGNNLGPEFTDACAALRGFAESSLQSSVVLSAGMNPRLYAYMAEFAVFYPDTDGKLKKRLILKVSDYRSALIQAKVLAKKGIWVSEYRIESGLNCGGHAFATDGFLMGPILEEFKQKKSQLIAELEPIYKQALAEKSLFITQLPTLKITAQGGIGTAEEQHFLLDHYQLDRTGWGSPFLLVPEATTVDQATMEAMAKADESDFYLSNASPLGVPFNNFRSSTAEINRLERIAKGRPGAPCKKKYLVSNTEFSTEPICTASREYQRAKIKQLEHAQLSVEEHQKAYQDVVAKTCLCEGLASAAYLRYDIRKPKENTAVAICPGPNTAYFNGIYSLEDMVDHIYGRKDLLATVERPHMFINEMQLYVNYIQKYLSDNLTSLDSKKEKYIIKFQNQLVDGIRYYEDLANKLFPNCEKAVGTFLQQLKNLESKINVGVC